jgi:hypothetical protein
MHAAVEPALLVCCGAMAKKVDVPTRGAERELWGPTLAPSARNLICVVAKFPSFFTTYTSSLYQAPLGLMDAAGIRPEDPVPHMTDEARGPADAVRAEDGRRRGNGAGQGQGARRASETQSDRLDGLEAEGHSTAEELAEDWRRWMEAVPPNSYRQGDSSNHELVLIRCAHLEV